ncbi:MAG: LamG domain-containing protein, partial [Prosthecobacter sp.]|nr:LamG domain-containing protein [Prosthecobacter sp.]
MMRHSFYFLICVAACLGASTAGGEEPPPIQESWETGYTGKDATGPQVLGYWKFDAGGELKDSSGKGNDLTLQGAVLTAAGKSGGGLESFPGIPVEDKTHAARTVAHPALSPKGAFSVEMWIRPKADFKPEQRCIILDKKYVDHTDYQWQISEADKAGQRYLRMHLGFGSNSKTFSSAPLKLEAETWQHIAFTYDAEGTGCFFKNGEAVGTMSLAGCGPITPGTKPLSIGDRIGSSYSGFPGMIDEVRLCEGLRHFEQVSLVIANGRRVWRRMEPAKPQDIVCTNLRRETMTGAVLKVTYDGKQETFTLPDLRTGASFTIKFNIDTSLKSKDYTLRARLELAAPKPYTTEQSVDFLIVPRPPPRMPVVMWGASPEESARLKEIGFTHSLGLHADVGEIWSKGQEAPPGKPEQIAATRSMLDRALADDLGVVASLAPAGILENDPKYARVDRQGKPYTRKDICASMPELPRFFENVGRSVAKAYGDHPAFAAALIDTEVRDSSQPSFNAVDVEGYRKFAGADIPAEVVIRNGVEWSKLKDFPANRVIPDDHPILKYYRWFWTVGDGWNALHSALNKGLKTAGRRDLWTWFDPAVRQPSISGAGGTVDVLGHWTYTYPDPQRIGLCADQLFAMSEASARHQRVMKMTQLIWYRSQTAPIKAGDPGDTVPWDDHDADAAYITIAPMHLREAFWTKIARPIQGIMYHGWQSLVPNPESTSAYRYTNPNTVHVLKQLIHEVVVPLGPTLMAIPDERSEVVMLESFTSQMFARRGSYGSNTGWSADLWLALQHAHVQTDILYEETLLKKGGLSGRKILLMPECDVLTQTVVAQIQAWQKKGGKIIADENLCPGLKADLVLPSFKRVKKADEDKAKVLELAKTLGPQVAALGVISKAT